MRKGKDNSMDMKKAGIWLAAAAACLVCLLSVPSFAEERKGPAFEGGTQIRVSQDSLSAVNNAAAAAASEAADTALAAGGPGAAVQSGAVEAAVDAAAGSTAAKTAAGDTPFGNVATAESQQYKKGALQGSFKIVGYYGHGTTYSGTVARANHTVAADTAVLPLGTRIFIGDTVYTVEDIGSAVRGNMIDIYFDSYEEAAGVTRSGYRFADVYLAVPR